MPYAQGRRGARNAVPQGRHVRDGNHGPLVLLDTGFSYPARLLKLDLSGRRLLVIIIVPDI